MKRCNLVLKEPAQRGGGYAGAGTKRTEDPKKERKDEAKNEKNFRK